MTDSTIIYTHTDEAPALATYSFLPVIQAYASTAGVRVETRDISLAGRIIAGFPERLSEGQRVDDALAELGALAKTPEANIIKLPNVSASSPQLKAAIAELQSHGYALPDYPESPGTDEDREVRLKPLGNEPEVQTVKCRIECDLIISLFDLHLNHLQPDRARTSRH